MTTNFQLVSAMNEAFGNPKGDPKNIDLDRLYKQSLNILDEFKELMVSFGVDSHHIEELERMSNTLQSAKRPNVPNVERIRDDFSDIHVFAYGGHHMMGIDADRDLRAVHAGVMTRFIKDAADREATIELHAKKGITAVYFEGEYPNMVMKSAADQPDAPVGKFLKSASYTDTKFYDPTA